MYMILIPLLLATGAAASCNADNCLRALRSTNRHSDARAFCATFTQGNVTVTAIPTYAAQACVANQNAPLSSRISSACSCIAVSTPAVPTATSATIVTGACAIVSSSSSAQKALHPAATPTVAAQLAYDCLNSVPLNKTAAIELVNAMEPYLEWQSDSAYKKNPPADYFYPPHDIFAFLASVSTNLQADKYANEYEFQEDLYQVFARGHDGHFIMYPDALTRAFQFGRKRSLVSISSDGISLPEIKIYEDVINSPSTASTIKLINDIDATTYVANFAYTASFNQDPDAAYNSMFFEKAFSAAGVSRGYFAGGGRMRYIYPGANTTFTFINGTTLTLDNIAEVKGSFSEVTDGASFYQQFCAPVSASTGSVAAIAAVDADEPEVVVTGYPPPVVIADDAIASGYYLNGTGYEDVAVISLLAFENESPVEFQSIAEQFFANAKRDGKTKLVVDLSANGGGYILQGYDLFRQLFPNIVQDGFSRFRENDMLLAISEIYSAQAADFDPLTATDAQVNYFETFYNYRFDLNPSNQKFESFRAKFDPHNYKGDPYTSIMQWNLDDPLTTNNATYGMGMDITGYGSRKNFTQPFAAEDIIMLYDGFCASTCVLFSEFMRTQAGVKSIAMGGRPKLGPIQGIGGIKGAEILSWSAILNNAQTALKTATPAQAAILNRLTSLPILRSSANGINVRDNILPSNVNDGLPAQFVVEEADCRLFWTETMVTDVTAVWKAAADAAFNGKTCVAGGIVKRKRNVVRKSRIQTRKVVGEAVAAKRERVEKRVLSEDWIARHVVKAIP